MNTTTNAPALTLEELKWHTDFVYRRVMNNTVLQSSAKFGRELKLTVQELVHSNVKTLQDIGQQIERVAREAGSSDFSAEGPFRINGVEASNWITFLKLQIKLKKAEEAAEEKKRRVKELREKIDNLKTPQELRADAETELRALMGEEVSLPAVS